MTEVIPGIYLLRLPLPVLEAMPPHVNAYLVHGDSGHLLVDTGWNTRETFDSLEKQLAEIGSEVREISQIVVTHIHPDHYGLTGRLKQLANARFALHDVEKGFIESRYINPDRLLEETVRWLDINGVPPPELTDIQTASMGMLDFVAPTYPDVTLYGGETISTGDFAFQVLLTPGHSAGHICLYEPTKKVLIAGDTILPTITPNVSLHPQSSDNPLGNYLNTLNELRQLDTELVLPGHEEPFSKLRARIDELIQHHEARNQEILATLTGQPKTAYQIASRITWGISADWGDMPFFHRRLAISETLAHLQFMTVNGQVAQLSRDSIIYYQQT